MCERESECVCVYVSVWWVSSQMMSNSDYDVLITQKKRKDVFVGNENWQLARAQEIPVPTLCRRKFPTKRIHYGNLSSFNKYDTYLNEILN